MVKRFNIVWFDSSNDTEHTWTWNALVLPSLDGGGVYIDAWDDFARSIEDDTGYICDMGGSDTEEELNLADCDSKEAAYDIAVRTKNFTDSQGWSLPSDQIVLSSANA